MKAFNSLAFAFLLLLFACKKNASTISSLDGGWKLISVKDKSTGATFTKPAGVSGEVIISFSGNNFSGHTLKNTFSTGEYTLQNETDITFGDFAMTKIMEDEWGSMFLSVLHACGLQSVHPCLPSVISFQGNKLTIASPLRYDLVLMKN